MDVNLLINFNNGFEILKIQSGQNGIELATFFFFIRKKVTRGVSSSLLVMENVEFGQIYGIWRVSEPDNRKISTVHPRISYIYIIYIEYPYF